MRSISTIFAGLLVAALASPALAGITVTSYQTVALVNGYAPTSQTEYFERQALVNVSPAVAHVSGDWMGPNASGTTPTWHYVGSAQTTTTTAFDANTYTVTAAGSFAFELTTTADFIDPSSSTTFSPGAAANYRGFFEIDTPVAYTISARLNQRGRVRLGSFEGLLVFDHSNHSPTPIQVSLTGTIPSGHYDFLASAGFGAPNLPNGVNHFSASGSFEHLTFTVQVPEPNALGVVIAICGNAMRRRKPCARAD